MKNSKYLLAAAITLFAPLSARAGDFEKNLPMVFDPQTKKYFIGGTSKFLLKPSEQAGLIDRIEIAVDGGEYHPYGQAIELGQEGKHTLKFRAINPVNNWSPVQFVEVFVDLTPPTTEAKFVEDHAFKDETGLYLGVNSSITLSAQDNLSGIASIEYSWDGTNFTTYSKPIQVQKPGKQTLFYRSIDRVGNTEPVKRLEYYADGNPPSSEVKMTGMLKPTIVNGKTYVNDSVAFQIVATDDYSKVKQTWVVVDGKPQLYIKPLYFLEEGPHSFSYYSIDNVGNREESKTFSFQTVSTPAHSLAMGVGKSVNTGGINFANRDFQLKIEASDNVVGLDHIEMKVDSDPEFKPYLEPVRFKTPGIHTVAYRSVDRVGNLEPAKTFTINIVDTMPETSLSTAQPLVVREGVTYSPAPNVISFNVTNGTSGVGIKETLVSVNDGPFQTYQGPLTVTADNSTYKVSYKSVDKLGNEETPKTATFHVIRTVPIVDLFVTNGKSAEEQVRTNYLDQPGAASPSRGLASESPKKHKARPTPQDKNEP